MKSSAAPTLCHADVVSAGSRTRVLRPVRREADLVGLDPAEPSGGGEHCHRRQENAAFGAARDLPG